MKNITVRINRWIRIHKLTFGLLGILFLTALFTVPKRLKEATKSPEQKYETTIVERRNLTRTVAASGKVAASQQVDLKFAVSGKLVWVGVQAGDYVTKGQAIAALDRRELEKKLKKELNDYLNERWDFEQDYDNYDASGQNLDQVTLDTSIKRLLEQAQFDLDNAVLDVEIATLAKELATLTTPIAGIVTALDTPYAGIHITPATAVFSVANPAQMEFTADVDEADIGYIRLGQKVAITLDAFANESFSANLDRIGFAAVTTRGGGTAFPVRIFLPENSAERFRVGMNGDAEIIIDTRENVLTIPSAAITSKNGNRYVRVISDREVVEKPVTTGLENDTDTEIIDGLTEGDIVIIDELTK